MERGIETPSAAGTIPPNELLFALNTKIVRQKLIILTKRELERRNLQTKTNKLAQDRNQLQTKYDMEVRSKKELAKQLEVIRTDFLLLIKKLVQV